MAVQTVGLQMNERLSGFGQNDVAEFPDFENPVVDAFGGIPALLPYIGLNIAADTVRQERVAT